MDLNSFLRLVKDPFFNFVLAIVLFLLGNLVSYVLFRMQIQPKQIFWDTKAIKLLNSSSPVIVNRIVIWNSGLDAIRCDDIARADPLAIIGFKKDELIRLRVLTRNNNRASEVAISFVEDHYTEKWRIDFEYLKRNQGFILEIIRLPSSQTRKIEVTGELIDGQIQHKSIEGSKRELDDFLPFSLLWIWARPGLRQKIKTTFISATAIFLVFYLLWFIPLMLKGYESIKQIPFIFILIIAQQFFGFIGYVFITWRIWSIPQIPNGLEVYYEESK